MHEVIVVCVDGSPGGYAAVAEAAELAFRFNARLIAISVEERIPKQATTMGEVDEVKRERDRYFEGVQAEAAAIALEHHATLTTEVGADLVVLGYQRHFRVLSLVTGATARKVSAASNASVLIVKGARTDVRRQRLFELYGLK
jgi:nucleotide-binding universal stress UspA family protein